MIAEKEPRIIITPNFGELLVQNDYVFRFENGILGFEDLKDYILVSDEDTEPFKWLIAIEAPEIGFPILSPFFIDQTYKYGRDYEGEENVPFVIITLGGGDITANLKAPVILNVETQKGEQVILPSEKYSPNHILKLNSEVK